MIQKRGYLEANREYILDTLEEEELELPFSQMPLAKYQ
jgi:hypothetical protein